MARLHASLPLLALLVASCGAAPPAEEPPTLDPTGLRARQLAPRPFPAAFQKEAILIAERVSIEGPSDLMEHIAVRAGNEYFETSVQTTERGLLQRVRRKPEAVGVDIRCQLDGWQIAALQELVVLQRPGEVPVTVVADGEAAWLPADGSPERREPRLTFRFQR